MSDEKLTALNGRVTQLVTMTVKLIETVTTLAEQQNKFAEQQNKFAEQQNKFSEEQRRLAEEQRITSGRLDEAIRIILEQNKKQNEFSEEQKRLAKEHRMNFQRNKKDLPKNNELLQENLMMRFGLFLTRIKSKMSLEAKQTAILPNFVRKTRS